MNALPPSEFDAGYRLLESHEPDPARLPRGFASERQAALNAQRRGFTVIPMQPGGALPAVSNWRSAGTTDDAVIHKLWKENPDYAVGASIEGVVVLCIDGRQGAEQLKALTDIYGPLPKTAAALSSGELYVFLRLPAGILVNADKLAPAVGVLSGGYIDLPSASNEDTDRWVNRRPMELAPRGWIDLIAEPSASQTQTEGNNDMGAGAEAIKKFREGQLPDAAAPPISADQFEENEGAAGDDEIEDEKDTSEIAQQTASAKPVPAAQVERRYYTKLEAALAAKDRGFNVFPLIPNTKRPAIERWQYAATRDPARIEAWWTENPDYNIGITMDGYFALDIDPRNGGEESLAALYAEHKDEFPKTLAANTQSGGLHIIYKLPPGVNLSSSKNKFGPGIDIKTGAGAYLVAAGSTIDGKSYEWRNERTPTICPAWIIERNKSRIEKSASAGKRLVEEDDDAIALATKWLQGKAPEAASGNRDNTAFTVAAKLYDFGVEKATVLDLMHRWNDERCQPPLDIADIERIVDSAERNRSKPIGVDHPDNASGFEPTEVEKPEKDHFETERERSQAAVTRERSATPYTFKPAADIPRREWLIPDMLCRENVSMLAGPPGVSKTTLLLLAALALATGREEILGIPVKERCPVWIWNQEDPLGELERRIAALRIAFDISDEELRDDGGHPMLYVDSGVDQPLMLATAAGGRKVKPGADLEWVVAEVRARNIGALFFDPLVEFHEAEENDNGQMRQVLGYARRIATTAKCAVLLGAHTRKPDKASSKGFAGELDALRGGSSQGGVIRASFTLLRGSADDAKKFGMEGSHLNYVRLDMAKTNLGKYWTEPRWFKFGEVPLGSRGEMIGVLRPVTLAGQAAPDRTGMLAAAMRQAGIYKGRVNEIVPLLPEHQQKLFGKNKAHWAREVRKAFVGPPEAGTDHGVLTWSCAGPGSPTVLHLKSSPSSPSHKNGPGEVGISELVQ